MFSLLFGQQSSVVHYRGFDIVIKPGQRVHVKSDRFDKWFFDGIVTEIYRDTLIVSYGFSEFFGTFSFSRGNTKTIKKDEVVKFLRFPDASLVTPASEALSKEELNALLRKVQDGSDSD